MKALLRDRGGLLSKTIWTFLLFSSLNSFAAEQIETTGSLAIPRRDHTATVLADGRVLILGGQDQTGALAAAEIYDSATQTFSAVGSMNSPRIGHAATRLSNGSVLITGGRDGSGPLTSAEVFDPATATFRALPAVMGAARTGHTSTLLVNGTVLIAGGDLAGTAEIFYPATETFSSPLIAMIEARAGQSATTLPENSILLAGGGTRSVEVFDPQTSSFLSWTAVLNEVRSGQTAITAPDSSVFFIGGEAAGTLERFDLLSLGSSSSVSIGAPVSSATLLANGKVLVLGSGLSSLFNPADCSLLPIDLADSLKRDGETATELPQGKEILVVGGVDVNTALVAPAALYNPAKIETDQSDYVPGENVIVTGSGWKPSEDVDLYVVDSTGWTYDSTATADASGAFTVSPYFVVLMQQLGVSFDLTAIGSQSGLEAKQAFTDANVQVSFATSGLPNGIPVSVSWSYSPNGSGPATFNSPGGFTGGTNTNSNPPSVNNKSVTYGFPTTLTNSGITYRLIGTSVPSPFNTGNSSNTVVTGTYEQIATKLSVTSVSAATYGSTFSVTVEAQDGGGTARPVSGATSVSLSVNTGTGTLGGTVTGTIPAGQSSLTLSGVTYSKAENAVKVTASSTAGDTLSAGISGTFNVLARAITVKATTDTKAYDGTNSSSAVPTITSGSLVGSDTASFTQSFDTKDVGSAKTLTAAGSVADNNGGNNYAVTFVPIANGSITALGITGNFTAQSKVYDGNTTASVLTRTLTGVLGGDSASVSLTGGTATFADKNVGTGKVVTLSGASLGGTAAGNYSLTSVSTATANIMALHITGAFTANSKIYDGTTSATVLMRSTVGDVGGVSLTGGTATFVDKNVGTGKVVTLEAASLTGADAGNYVLDSVATTTANITALHITGAFTASDKIYDGATSAAVLTRSTVGDIGGVSLTGGTAAFADKNVGTGKVVTLTGAILSGADASNYILDSVATTTANITALHITGTFTAGNKIYDGNNSASVLTELPLTDVGGVSLTGGTATFADKNVGTGKLVTLAGASLSGVDAGNYVLDSVATATANITALHITGTFTASSKSYDGNTSASVLSESTVGDVGGVSLTGGTASFADKNVGTGKLVTLAGASLSGADAGNYVLDSVATTTANITALHITGTFTAGNKIYDGNDSASVLTELTVGDVGGVSLTGGTATFADKNVGNGKLVTLAGASLSGADAGNYVLDSVATTTANITALHITGTFTAGNKIYDGNDSASVLTELTVGDVGGVSLAGGTATFADKNVGNGKLVTLAGASLSGVDAGNYVLDSVAMTTANITALHITGTFTASDKIYDGNTSAGVLTESLAGVLAADLANVGLTGGTAAFADKNVASDKTVTLTGASLSGLDAGNYELDSVATTTANITALHITGGFTASGKSYDGNTSATVLTRSTVGDVGGVSLTGGTATFADKNVGNGKTVTLAGASLGGADAGNYVLDSVATTTANITGLHITGAFTADSKIYDGNTSATVLTETTVGDVGGVSLTGGTAMFADQNVGTGKTVTLTGAILSGADASNYLLDSVATTTANITALHITGTFTVSGKIYDGTTTATVLTRSTVGDVGGVNLTGGTATFADKHVGTGKVVTLTGAVLSDAVNYVLDSVATTTANISPLPITISAVSDTKVYDGGTSSSGVPIFATLMSGDTKTATQVFDSKNVGARMLSVTSYAITDGNNGNNYAVTLSTATGSITAKGLTITGAVAADKVYDGNTTETVSFTNATLVGVVSPDVVTISSSSYGASFADALVGSAKPVTVTGVTLGGADAANYTVSQPTGLTASINAWAWNGFFQPVDNAPVLNRVNSGSAIPVKFNLGGNKGLAIFAPGYPGSVPITISGSNVMVSDIAPTETVTAGNSGLTYDASANQYVYVWKTDKSWANSSRQLQLKLADGSVHVANFTFTK